MRNNKEAMRRAVLCKLFDHLQEHYGIDWTKETFVDGDLSLHQLDAILAFKSDARLTELRDALSRIDEGTFGRCISCKAEIGQNVLDVDPAQRFCSGCEREFSHADMHDYESHASY